MRIRIVTAVALALSVTALAGCESAPTSYGDRHDFGVPGVVSTIEPGVEFYPACGNEVLSYDNLLWYQYDPANIDEFPNPERTLEAWREGKLGTLDGSGDGVVPGSKVNPAGVAGRGGAGAPGTALVRGAPVGTVAAPGPGDDVGTLIIYSGGIAYWESTSGDLATWLTDHEINYTWVC